MTRSVLARDARQANAAAQPRASWRYHGRSPWLGVLLLATGVVLANDRPAANQDAGAAQPQQTQPDAAQRQTDDAQAPAGEAQGGTPTGEEATVIAVPGGTALGMSILGNQEAPKSLVIVPWKTSELGETLGIAPMLDDSRQPVDKDVFMRALRYYEIRSEGKP